MLSEGSTDALMGSDNLMTRSFDGRLTKIILPDATMVYTYKEKKATDEMEAFTFNTVTIIYRPDGTVIRIQQDGDVVIISGEERQKINLKGQNLERGKDVDYLFEMNGKPEERHHGVYTVNLRKSKIWTRDDENNVFEIHSDGTAKCKLSVTLDLENSQKTIDEIVPNSPRYTTDTYIDPEAEYLEAPKNFMTPRLFVIQNDNTGYELLNEQQISSFRYLKSNDVYAKYMEQELEEQFTSHCWLTKFANIRELISDTQYIKNIKIPQKLKIITQTPITPKFPPKEVYLYRNLISTKPFDQEFRERVLLSITNKDNWFSKKRYDFGIIDTAHIPELEENHKVQRRILEERQHPDVNFDYEVMKENLMVPLFEEKSPYSILFDIQKHIDDKESRKIIEDLHFRKLPLEIETLKIDDMLANINEDGENIKSFKKKQVEALITEVKAMQEIKFDDNFYGTLVGKEFLQLYPQTTYYKKPKKVDTQYEGLDQYAVDDPNYNGKMERDTLSGNQKTSSPMVYLENENPLHKGNDRTAHRNSPRKPILPSIHKRKMELIKEKTEKERADADDWHNKKTYKFNHDGAERVSNPLVPKYLKTTFPEAEFNEDYIAMEKLTDKRLKTSSVSKRLYFNAPSINQIRKSGQHNFISEALDKRRTYEEMMGQVNLMVTAELCDPLNKMLKVISFCLIKI